MNLEAIATKLAQDDPTLIEGQTLFVHHMPADCDRGAMLREYFGGTDIDHELPGYRKTSFQVIVRASDYTDGKTLAESISASLTFQGATLSDGTAFNYCRPRTEPFVYPLSPGDVWEFSVTYDACYVLPHF